MPEAIAVATVAKAMAAKTEMFCHHSSISGKYHYKKYVH